MRLTNSSWGPLVLGLLGFFHSAVLGHVRSNQQSQPAPQFPFSCVLVDLEDEGLSLSAAADGVMFDIDGDGVSERVAWPKSGSRLGLLAMDVNNNGVIDSGAELIDLSFKHPSVTKPSSGYMVSLLLQGVSIGEDKKPYGSDGRPLMQSSTIGKSPLIFSGVIALVLSVTMIAAWLPARRASRVNPMLVLRRE